MIQPCGIVGATLLPIVGPFLLSHSLLSSEFSTYTYTSN